MKTMYEINWHYKDNEQTQFSHCTVTPITIVREGVLPGCSAVSITAKGSDGRTFQGSPRRHPRVLAGSWDQSHPSGRFDAFRRGHCSAEEAHPVV